MKDLIPIFVSDASLGKSILNTDKPWLVMRFAFEGQLTKWNGMNMKEQADFINKWVSSDKSLLRMINEWGME